MPITITAKCDHERIKRDTAEWNRLANVGEMIIEADDIGPAETIELRNCACGSTLARRKAI